MSSLNLNKVIIAGRLAAAPELKQTTSGVPVVSGSIAVNRKKKDKDNNPIADFFNFVAWRATAEFISKYFQKGSSICIIGELQNRSYVDGGGTKRYVAEIHVEEAKFVDNKPIGEDQEAISESYTPTPAKFEDVEDDGDLPF